MKLTTLLVSCVVGVYALDFALLVFFPATTPSQTTVAHRQRIARGQGRPFDLRTKLDVITEMRRAGFDTFPTITGSHLLTAEKDQGVAFPLLPVAGISNVTTVFCNEAGTYVTYESDRYGFRNPPHAWTAADVDVALVGDSFAHGYCVDSDSELGGALRKMGHSVINLGVAGNGPLLNLATIVEYATLWTPRNVVWLHYEGNDLHDLGNERSSTVLLEYLNLGYSQRLADRQGEIDRVLTAFSDDLERRMLEERAQYRAISTAELAVRFLKLTDLRLRLAKVTYTPRYCRESPDLLFERVLRRAREVVSSWGGRLHFVYLPTFRRYYYAKVDHDEFCNRDAVLGLARDLAIPLTDIHSTFAASEDPLSLFPLRIKGHYTPEAYESVAQRISHAVTQ